MAVKVLAIQLLAVEVLAIQLLAVQVLAVQLGAVRMAVQLAVGGVLSRFVRLLRRFAGLLQSLLLGFEFQAQPFGPCLGALLFALLFASRA